MKTARGVFKATVTASHMNISNNCVPRSIFGRMNVVFFNEGHILRIRHHMSHSFLSQKRKGKYARLSSVLEKCLCTADIILGVPEGFWSSRVSQMGCTTFHRLSLSQCATGLVGGRDKCVT